MFNLIYDIIFVIASIYILTRAIAYGIYEIKSLENKSGGIAVICFSVLITIFVCIIILTK